MSTAIVSGGRGGMNRGFVSAMAAMIAAGMSSLQKNVLVIKAKDPQPETKAFVKPAGMSPSDYARYRISNGRRKKKKNLFHCARLAKVHRRRIR